MSQYTVWQMDSSTLKVLKDVEEAIKDKTLELSTGGLLPSATSDDLARAYSYSVGFIDGLEYLKKLLTQKDEEKETDDDTRDRE